MKMIVFTSDTTSADVFIGFVGYLVLKVNLRLCNLFLFLIILSFFISFFILNY